MLAIQRRHELRLQSVREDLTDAKVILTHGRRTQALYSWTDLSTNRISISNGLVTLAPVPTTPVVEGIWNGVGRRGG
jgi:hypothetical protein